MSIFDNASYTVGLQGPPGAATVEQIGDLDARVAGIEALTIPVVIGDLSDVDTATDAPASGDLLQFDGTDWVPYTPEPIEVTFGVTLEYVGSPIDTENVPLYGIYMPDACTVTGWVLDGDTSITITVERATAASPLAYSTISGSEPPTKGAGSGTASDMNLTTWTTAIGAGDRIRTNVTSASATFATLTLLFTREIG